MDRFLFGDVGWITQFGSDIEHIPRHANRYRTLGPPSLPAEEPYGDSRADHEDSDENARFEQERSPYDSPNHRPRKSRTTYVKGK